MSGDPTLGTWSPDPVFNNGIGGSFYQPQGYYPTQSPYQVPGQEMVDTPYPYGARSGFQGRGDPAVPYQPMMTNFIQSDGIAARGGGRGGEFSISYDDPPNPYGDLSGVPQQLRDPTGGARDGSLYPGGDYNDNFNAPYQNPYGDTSGVPGGLLDGFQGNYSDPTGGATLGGGNTYSPSYYTPDFGGRGARMPDIPTSGIPAGPNTFGGPASEVAPSDLYDQTYMDKPIGPYGSLLGGNDGPPTYERMDGTPINPPASGPPPGQDYYLFPNEPLVMPSGPNSDASPPPMPAQQYFSERGGTPPSNYDPSFGLLNMNFQPMPGDPTSGKITDRANQTGGFVSYGGQGNIYDSNSGLLPGLLSERR